MLTGLLIGEIVGFPEIGETGMAVESFRSFLPKHLAAFHAMIANEIDGFTVAGYPALLFIPLRVLWIAWFKA